MVKHAPIKISIPSSYGSNTWVSEGLKLREKVILQSDIEYAYFLHADVGSPEIESFKVHPFGVPVRVGDEIENTFFDMEIIYNERGRELWEIKRYSELLNTSKNYQANMKQISLQTKWCDDNGIIYKVKTEQEINWGTKYISNLIYIFHLLKRTNLQNAKANSKQMLEDLKTSSSLRISDFIDYGMDAYQCMQLVSYLLFKGYVTADIVNEELSYKTEVKYCAKKI